MSTNLNLTDTVELLALPIFQAGSYPQGDFDVDALQALADAYDPSFHEAPNYLAHEDNAGQRPAGHLAFGWVKRLYLKGQTLFADLTQVPKIFADLVRAGRIKKRSVELYTNLQGKGLYLRALAWPMIPQLKGLADLHPSQIFNETDDAFLTLTSESVTSFQEKETQMTDPNFITQDQLKIFLDEFKTDLLKHLNTLQAVTQAKNFCEQMVLAGKMTPAERSTEEPLLIAQLQREQSLSFAENETPLSSRRMDYYRNRTSLLPPNSPPTPSDPPSHQKLIQYFHENQAFFNRMNVTLDDLIAADRPPQINPLTHP